MIVQKFICLCFVMCAVNAEAGQISSGISKMKSQIASSIPNSAKPGGINELITKGKDFLSKIGKDFSETTNELKGFSQQAQNTVNQIKTEAKSVENDVKSAKSDIQKKIHEINGQFFREDENQLTPVVKNPKTGNWVEQSSPRYIKVRMQWFHQVNGKNTVVELDEKNKRWIVPVSSSAPKINKKS